MFASVLKISTLSGLRFSRTMFLSTNNNMKYFSTSALPLSLNTTLAYPNLLMSHRSCRYLSTSTDKLGPNSNLSKAQGEIRLKEKLSLTFPTASCIQVEDISGGCGSMYQIHVESVDFKGLNTVKQHQLITKALQDEIKDMHGIRISTKIPASS